MLRNVPKIKLYGALRCHKTRHYQKELEKLGVSYQFLDVESNKDHAATLRGLYSNRKLNFPTITIGNKKLRNPKDEELVKWIHKLLPSMTTIEHDTVNQKYTLDINGEEAVVDYVLKDNIMYLVHSEVPYNLRGKGIGKELVLQTFEKLTDEGHKAVAMCSYIRAVKNRSEKWRDIIE